MNKAAITLLVATLMLVTIGVVMLFSTSALEARDRYGDSYYLLKRQLAWLVIGAVGSVMAASLPYAKLRGLCLPALAIAAGLTALVLIPHIGIKVAGARRWLGVGGFRFQPSEIAKLALVVWLAHWLAKEKRRIDGFARGFVVPITVIGVSCLLVLVEPDFGTS